MSLGGTRFLVLLADEVGEEQIRAALPPAAPIWVSRLDDVAGRADKLVDELSADVVLVACQAGSEAALNAIRRIGGRQSECAIIVLYVGSPNGFLDPAFEAGADDLITLPQAPPQLAFAIEKVIARRRGPGGTPSDVAPMISVLGPEGRYRQDADCLQPRSQPRRGRDAPDRRRPRPAVRRRRAGARPPARADALRPRARGRDPRRRQGRQLRRPARLGGQRAALSGAARPGGGGLDPAPAPAVRDPARPLRLRDRRHAAGVLAGGDRRDRQLVASMHGGDARRTVAEGHEDRLRDAAADGLRPREHDAGPEPGRHERRASRRTTSATCSGRRRTCSCRATGRSRARSRRGRRSSRRSRVRGPHARSASSPRCSCRSAHRSVSTTRRDRPGAGHGVAAC